MIAEFTGWAAAMRERSALVGKILIDAKHYALLGVSIRIVHPYFSKITPSSDVCIVVGRNYLGEDVCVNVPPGLFENATEEQLRTWIQAENDWNSGKTQEAMRQTELVALQTLLKKYPEYLSESAPEQEQDERTE